jgi:hypothetical protein
MLVDLCFDLESRKLEQYFLSSFLQQKEDISNNLIRVSTKEWTCKILLAYLNYDWFPLLLL